MLLGSRKKPYSWGFQGSELVLISQPGLDQYAFRVANQLGIGKETAVFRAVQLFEPHQEVAIKMQNRKPETKDGYRYEASILQKVGE